MKIPTIDLNIEEASASASKLREALETTGFFYLKQNLLAREELEAVLKGADAFFSLPIEVKRPLFDSSLNRGYTSMGEETLDPETQKTGDTKEGYYIGRHVTELDKMNVDKFTGANVYPPEDETGLDGWRKTMDGYVVKARRVCEVLLKLIACSLDLSEDYFDSFFTEPLVMLRLLRYSPQPSAPNDGVLGCGKHSDYGCLTLLLTNEVPGLQILHDGEWVDVAPIAYQGFIVNIGDMLERWSNGRFKSTVHRVVTVQHAPGETPRARLSAPFFFEPNYDTVVECLPNLGSPKWPPCTSGEYLKSKVRRRPVLTLTPNPNPNPNPNPHL